MPTLSIHHSPIARRCAAVLAALIVVCAGSCLSPLDVRATTTPSWASLIGKPVVFKWGFNKQVGNRYALVFRADGPTYGTDAYINGQLGYHGDDGSFNILARGRRRQCYQVQYVANGTDVGHGKIRFSWDPGTHLHGVKAGDNVQVHMSFGWAGDSPFGPGPWIDTTAHVYTAKGPHKSVYGQALLTNEWPQRVLRKIGCNGRLIKRYRDGV